MLNEKTHEQYEKRERERDSLPQRVKDKGCYEQWQRFCATTTDIVDVMNNF